MYFCLIAQPINVVIGLPRLQQSLVKKGWSSKCLSCQALMISIILNRRSIFWRYSCMLYILPYLHKHNYYNTYFFSFNNLVLFFATTQDFPLGKTASSTFCSGRVSCDELVRLRGECGLSSSSYVFLLLYEGYLEQDQNCQNHIAIVSGSWEFQRLKETSKLPLQLLVFF